MNKGTIIQILKKQQVEVCKGCDKRRKIEGKQVADIDTCFTCPVHKLVNKVVEALNGA